jgi:hypothetical protein
MASSGTALASCSKSILLAVLSDSLKALDQGFSTGVPRDVVIEKK